MKPQVTKRIHRFSKLFPLFMIVALLFAACSSGSTPADSTVDESTSNDSQNSEDEATSDDETVKGCTEELTPIEAAEYSVPKANDNYKIALMQVSLEGYYYEGIAYGAFEAADEAGVELEMYAASGYASPEQQMEQVEDALQKGVDAILLAPSDINASIPVVEMANERGIPVINFSTGVASDDVYKVLQSDFELGAVSADEVANLLGDEGGQGIVIGGPAEATWSQDRTAGFTNQVEEMYPQIEILSVENQMVNPAEGLKSFEDATQRTPDIDWVYNVHGYILPGESLPDKYRGNMQYVAMGLEPNSLEALEKGWISSIYGIVPIATGKISLSRAVEILNGEDAERYTCLPAPLYTYENYNNIEMNMVNALELFPEDWRRPW